jgi:hypothetical protein
MADGLADLGLPVEDRILIINILWGLNQCFEHVSSIIWCYSPFLNFFKVQDDLLLEEIHMDSTGPTAAPTALYTNTAPPTCKPPSSTSSRPPGDSHGDNGGGNQNRNNNKNRNSGGTNGKNSNGSGVVITLLASSPLPLHLMAGPAPHGHPMATRGRTTWLC